MLIVYGATGFTGRLVVQAALRRGTRPLLAGRDPRKLRPLAEALGLPWRAFALDDAARLRRELADASAVLNLAGPFSATAAPLAEACLAGGTHYVDVTGEVAVLRALAARHREAAAAGVVLLPGAGFDVVPTDCLALHLKRRLPEARRLRLAVGGVSMVSRGTAKTVIESLGRGVLVRRGGRLVELDDPPAATEDFGEGPRPVVGVSWGDVVTAHLSTGIATVEGFLEAPRGLASAARPPWPVRRLCATRPAQRVLKRLADLALADPDEARRRAGRAVVVGRAEDAAGRRAVARLTLPEPYTLTAETAATIAAAVAAGRVTPGFHTPATAFGPDFILGFSGVDRRDLGSAA